MKPVFLVALTRADGSTEVFECDAFPTAAEVPDWAIRVDIAMPVRKPEQFSLVHVPGAVIDSEMWVLHENTPDGDASLVNIYDKATAERLLALLNS